MGHEQDLDLFVFDMGNVVIRDITTLEAIAAEYGFDFDELHEDYRHYVYPLMDGVITSDLYWDHVAHQFGIKVKGDPLATYFRPRWNEPVVEFIHTLRAAGKRVVVGSNTYAPHGTNWSPKAISTCSTHTTPRTRWESASRPNAFSPISSNGKAVCLSGRTSWMITRRTWLPRKNWASMPTCMCSIPM
jgi:hypothetical protein